MGAITKSFENGEFLFREGDRPDALYIVQKGAISIRKRRGGAQVELARIRPGEVIGEMAFFDRQVRSASAMSITKTEVLIVSFQALDKIYQGVPPYFQTIIRSMAERLRRADESIRKLEHRTVQNVEAMDDIAQAGADSEEPAAADELDPLPEDEPPGESGS